MEMPKLVVANLSSDEIWEMLDIEGFTDVETIIERSCQAQQKEDLRWFVELLEEKGTLVVAETDRILLKFVEHNKPNALLLDITDIHDLKNLAEGKG